MTLLDVTGLEKILFYVRKQISWAMGKSGRGFGLEVMRRSKLHLKKKQKTQIIEYDGS